LWVGAKGVPEMLTLGTEVKKLPPLNRLKPVTVPRLVFKIAVASAPAPPPPVIVIMGD
jgi:hypothetical protein